MKLNRYTIVIRGAGEMASGIAFRLFKSNFQRICMTEVSQPLAVRRAVSFCEAVHEGKKTVSGVTARLVKGYDRIQETWEEEAIPVIMDPEARVIDFLKPEVVIDAIMAKKNLGTKITDAALVIGVGPGFHAGMNTHLVVETNRGHNLGRVIYDGEAERDTGLPGAIGGYTVERVFRAPKNGQISSKKAIGDLTEKGDVVAEVDGMQVRSRIGGVIRGIVKDGTYVSEGMKIGDVDPRGVREYCYSVSDKTLAIAGGVLESILSRFNC